MELRAASLKLLAKRAAESQIWANSGHRSPEDWLAQTGTLNASGKLETLPNLDKAVRDGELSGPKLNELAAAVGARIEAALDAETDVVFKEARAQGRNEPLAAYRADALERLVCGGGAKVDATVVIRVDESRLRGEEGMCESPSTGPLPASEAIGAILAGPS